MNTIERNVPIVDFRDFAYAAQSKRIYTFDENVRGDNKTSLKKKLVSQGLFEENFLEGRLSWRRLLMVGSRDSYVDKIEGFSPLDFHRILCDVDELNKNEHYLFWVDKSHIIKLIVIGIVESLETSYLWLTDMETENYILSQIFKNDGLKYAQCIQIANPKE